MVEDGLPDAVGGSPSQTSKARTEPEQTVSHPALTVGDSAEVSISSHAAVSKLSAASCCEVPVMGNLLTGVGKSNVSNPGPPDMASMWINYLPSSCEQRETPTLAMPCCCLMAQREPQQGGRLDDFPLDPSLALEARNIPNLASPGPLDDATAPAFRNHLRPVQTSPTERPQPYQAQGGIKCQLEKADLLEQENRRMTILAPLIIDLHTANLGNTIALVPVSSNLMCLPVPPQVAMRILRPQDDLSSLPGLDTITSAELALAIETSMAADDTAQMYADVILRHTVRLRNAETIAGKLPDAILEFQTFVGTSQRSDFCWRI